ncbi:ketopantoate reductase family protein [Microbispora sp. ATCC PTA-5024]|uniref:ketopantoate reductase family protein n=1 Tax=Microbispora sp. ATCC PTA-5024 TaxID=316330 RepID=UPI0003DD972A|nr:2-dehydropantoate 2-reductase N-terminal domain-containing protein [Microbispora sp. ATCC PTA-5024]ETK30873.1 2-dehydropantoate 2-reductase [Microbispora sp. ATCC PTA-5024]
MRYIVIGAGAIGGTIGGRLFQSGHDVLLVARGAHHEELRAGGLRLVAPDGEEVLPIPVADGPVPVRDGDVLVVATKTQDTVAALRGWDDAPVVCAQNAVQNERMALRRFSRVYGMCLWMPALHLEPGVVASYGAPLSGMLPVGRYPQGVDDLVQEMADDLGKSRFAAFAVPDVMRWKYGKLLGNLGNAVEALCGHAEGTEAVSRRARQEGETVLAAAGIPFLSDEEERERRGDLVEMTPLGGVERPGGSSWQSLAKGSGSIEVDYLNGEIVLLGRLHGVPTPVNLVLQREATRLAREGGRPGSLDVAALERLLP